MKSLNVRQSIGGLVFGLHLAFVLFLFFTRQPSLIFSQVPKLRVQTVQLPPPSYKLTEQIQETSKQRLEVRGDQTKLSQAKKTKKKSEKRSESAKKKKEQGFDLHKKEIAEQLKKSIEALNFDLSSSASLEHLQVPSKIQNIKLDLESSSIDSSEELRSYYGILSSSLSHLVLPEFGSVEVYLTLRKDGQILRLEVVSNESQKNRQYVQGMIERMRFPGFVSFFSHTEEKTFHISLRNIPN